MQELPFLHSVPLLGRHVALLGPTASGKTALALELARRFVGVEIVSVDSMAVYRGMDIGTAKPTPIERAGLVVHMIDIVEPSADFTVTQFQAAARTVLADISARGKRALLVGGTGLYLRSVIDDLQMPGRWPEIAASLENDADRVGPEVLHARLEELDPVAAGRIEPANRRRVLRALEVTLGSGSRFSSFGPGLDVYPPTDVVQVGIPYMPKIHDELIEARFAQLLDRGLLQEVRQLVGAPGGLSRTARQAIGYREMLDHLENGTPYAEAIDAAVRRTRTFARRQWAWFRRDPRIDWMDPASDLLDQLLERWECADPGTGTEPAEIPGPGPRLPAGRACHAPVGD